jgi:hypothetical protein
MKSLSRKRQVLAAFYLNEGDEMKLLNKPEDVYLKKYLKGTETFDYSLCECCGQSKMTPLSGVNRCQALKVGKRLKGEEGQLIFGNYLTQCHIRASVQIDGKWYCGIHSKTIGDENE